MDSAEDMIVLEASMLLNSSVDLECTFQQLINEETKLLLYEYRLDSLYCEEDYSYLELSVPLMAN